MTVSDDASSWEVTLSGDRGDLSHLTRIFQVGAVRVTEDTWQLDWRESSFDKNGNPGAASVTWRAMLRTLLAPPKDAEAMSRNPIGLYIDEFHWDKVGAGGPQ